MGWCSGGELADEMFGIFYPLMENLPPQAQAGFAQAVIDAFESMDCDVMQETEWWNLAKKKCKPCKGDGCEKCDDRGWIDK